MAVIVVAMRVAPLPIVSSLALVRVFPIVFFAVMGFKVPSPSVLFAVVPLVAIVLIMVLLRIQDDRCWREQT
jgi:high-affinity Fe2+/Pb2+ permease